VNPDRMRAIAALIAAQHSGQDFHAPLLPRYRSLQMRRGGREEMTGRTLLDLLNPGVNAVTRKREMDPNTAVSNYLYPPYEITDAGRTTIQDPAEALDQKRWELQALGGNMLDKMRQGFGKMPVMPPRLPPDIERSLGRPSGMPRMLPPGTILGPDGELMSDLPGQVIPTVPMPQMRPMDAPQSIPEPDAPGYGTPEGEE
jgi:hypothetical protein